MELTGSNQNGAHRFTRDGSANLERQLAVFCRGVAQQALRVVPLERLEGLVLGGGYGRGQGGVLRTETGEAPYNDLEFYVFLRGNHLLNEVRHRSRFQRLGEALSPEIGLHVEFKVDALSKLRRRPVSIFSYDLLSGHRIISGSESVFLGCEAHRDPRNIDPTEATRLLLNRCSGLLLAQELLLKPSLTSEEADFIGRNLAKARLALGDAMLAAEGQYHWDCLERARRLGKLDAANAGDLLKKVIEHHAAGVEFKLHPTRTVKSITSFRTEHREVSELALSEWLWIENRRLKANFSTLREYSFSSVDKCVENCAWRNLLLNVRTFGAGATLDKCSPRYPRERLLNTLPLLLGKEKAASQLETRRYLQQQLRSRAEDWPGLVAAYKHVWSCYG